MDKDIFMFSFSHEVDAHRAYHRRPWSCKGGHLILKKWNPKITWQEVEFSSSTFWVQIHGFLALWNSEQNLRKIGMRLGEVVEVDLVGEPSGAWKKFFRIRVDIPVGKPLLPGLFLPRPNNTDAWIGLKYEKLADVCYQCGVIGHEEWSCTGTVFQLCNSNGAMFKAARPWLRPDHDALPPGVFEQPVVATNGTRESLEQSSENYHSSAGVCMPEHAPPMSYNAHQVSCTSPPASQGTCQAHDILTSAFPAGTECTTPVTTIPAKLDSQLVTAVLHHASRAEARSLAGPISNPPACGLRTLFRLTPIQAGLKPIEVLTDPSSAQNTTCPVVAHSPCPKQLNTQSSLPPTSSCVPTSEPHPEHQHKLSQTAFTPISPRPTNTKHHHISQTLSLSTPNETIPPPKPLKRKFTEKEFEVLAKRLRCVARGPEPVYFDPETVALIPQSSLE